MTHFSSKGVQLMMNISEPPYRHVLYLFRGSEGARALLTPTRLSLYLLIVYKSTLMQPSNGCQVAGLHNANVNCRDILIKKNFASPLLDKDEHHTKTAYWHCQGNWPLLQKATDPCNQT